MCIVLLKSVATLSISVWHKGSFAREYSRYLTNRSFGGASVSCLYAEVRQGSNCFSVPTRL